MNIQGRSHRYQSSRQTILATSRDVFFRHGYIDASMDAIAQRSGVSKTTLYAHFDSKEALFNQVVVDVILEHADDAAAVLDVPTSGDFRESMVAVGCRLNSILMEPETIALLRLCIVEGMRMPQVCKEAIASARSALLQALSRFFQGQAAPHGLHVEDPQEAAELFLTLTTRNFQVNSMMPWHTPVGPEFYRTNADQVADLMIRLYGRSVEQQAG